MKIGLYFGSFNPVHIGHLIIASHVFEETSCGQIWFVVSPQNPLKKQSTLLNENHRKRLLDLAIEDDDRFRSTNIEFKLARPSFTIDTMIHLDEQYPEHQFFIIMGSDSFSNIKKWKNSDILLKNYDVVVYERPGFKTEGHHKRVRVLQAPLLSISSTYVRSLVHSNKSIRYLVPDIVRREIEVHHFYKNT